MKNLTLRKIAQCCHGTYIGDEAAADTEVSSVVIDSRQAERGSLFVAIEGERVDGHTFADAVFAQGAAAVLAQRRLEDPKGPYILVESTKQALKDLAAFYRNSLDIRVVGITGSVGKTSTKEMIASVLGTKYRVLKTAGNFNNEIGLPLTIFRLREEDEAAVLEMGISDFGEMHRLGEIARPDICVITNIGLCHLENLGTRDGILKAKTEIFDHLNKTGTVILNGEDDKLSTIEIVNEKKPLFYGKSARNLSGEQNFVYASDVADRGLEGVEALLHFPGEERKVLIPIPGEHNVLNALAGACVGLEMGLSVDEICLGIEKAQTIDGRTNLIRTQDLLIIDDCYNANPVSMKAALDVLATAKGRKIAVLGDMGELGTDERQLHREVGKYAAERGIDALFCCGELAGELAAGAKEAETLSEIYHFERKEDLMRAVGEYQKKGDTVLVKASHFMNFPDIVRYLQASEQS